ELAPRLPQPAAYGRLGLAALQRRRHHQHQLDPGADPVGHGRVLDDHAGIEAIDVAQIDHSCDAGAHPLAGPGQAADADAVDLALGVIAEGDHVAVAAEARADLLGDGQTLA